TLDPTRPEALVYAFGGANRTPFLIGAMYMDRAGSTPPQPGGCLTQWHDHTNLCLAPTAGVVGTVASDGSCPAGSVNHATGVVLLLGPAALRAVRCWERAANSGAPIPPPVRGGARGWRLIGSPAQMGAPVPWAARC